MTASGNDASLPAIAESALALARRNGADQAAVEIGTGVGLSVTVRMQQVETLEHQRDKGIAVTVYKDGRKGTASSTDMSGTAIRATVDAACTIASMASKDDCAGLIDPEYLAQTVPDLDLHHPWNLAPDAAIDLALACEATAVEKDQRIRNSDGASVSTYTGTHLFANSHGFSGGWNWSSHALDCTVIASENGSMQRDGWYTKARAQQDLEDPIDVGRQAAARALARLGARKLPTRSAPVIFEAPVAGGLFSSFVNAISGAALYRKASFLLGTLGNQVFTSHINIHERPHVPKAMGSAPFDGDGMATRDLDIIAAGNLQTYLLSAYSARKLGMQPTGHAGGVHNLVVEPGADNLQQLLQTMGTGLLITDLIGFGVNQITGDYSRGAAGFWVADGEIQFPVEEVTIAGNLRDMYKHIVAVGNDVDERGNIHTGSVLIEHMTIGGD